MPLYEYQCKKCGHRFEKIQLFSDAPLKHCPECGGAVEKLISRSAVRFKGTGWYATDYAKKSGSSSSKSNEDGGTSKSSDDDSSASKAQPAKSAEGSPAADSKPAAKSGSSEKKSPKK